MENVHTNIYTIIQITGDILTVTEEVERNEEIGLTTRSYTFGTPKFDEVDPFISGLIIQ